MATHQSRKQAVRISHSCSTEPIAETPIDSSTIVAPTPPSGGAGTDSHGQPASAPSPPLTPPAEENAPGDLSAIPTQWITWRAGVDALLRAMARLSERAYGSDPIDPEQWAASTQEVTAGRSACRAAADAVGTAAERMAISLTLYRTQPDVERLAERMALEAPQILRHDPDTRQRWQAGTAEAIRRLWHRLEPALGGREVTIEMREAAIRRAPPPPGEQEPPMTRKQREAWAALSGRALTADALAAEIDCDRGTLITEHLKPLMQSGRLKNDRKVGGYYRPDKPPRAN